LGRPPERSGPQPRPGTPSPLARTHRVVERTSRRRGPARLVRSVALLLVVLTVAAPVLVLVLLPRQEVTNLSPAGRSFNVLLVGSDSRADLSEEERRELTTGAAGGDRSDTIMLMTVQGANVGLLSFPRDLSVERCDGSVGRINGAVAIDGPGCLVDTVERLSGMDVHHHVTITFGGFRDVVDAVGGVELCLDRAIRDRSAGIDLPEGCQVLDGADALGYVRVRKIDSDFARIERQQQFLRALAKELLDPTLVVRPWRLVAITLGVSRAMVVDQRLGPIDLLRLAIGLRLLAGGGAVTATVPSEGYTSSSGAALQRVRQPNADALFAGFADGSALRAPAD
jgi:LCP family protein required for cell wall assembly